MNIFYLSMGSWFKFSLTFYLTSLIYFKRHDFDAADCLMKIVKQEGFWSLWNGTAPSILLAANPAIHFMVYESLKRYFQRIFNTSVSTPNTRLGFFSTEDNNRNTASVLLLSWVDSAKFLFIIFAYYEFFYTPIFHMCIVFSRL